MQISAQNGIYRERDLHVLVEDFSAVIGLNLKCNLQLAPAARSAVPQKTIGILNVISFNLSKSIYSKRFLLPFSQNVLLGLLAKGSSMVVDTYLPKGEELN